MAVCSIESHAGVSFLSIKTWPAACSTSNLSQVQRHRDRDPQSHRCLSREPHAAIGPKQSCRRSTLRATAF